MTGFDDYENTQHTAPALTSVRKPFEEIGRTAAGRLLDQIAGQKVPAGPIAIPGVLVPRRSCGCGLAPLLGSPADGGAGDRGWQTSLAAQLVELAHYPLPRDPAVPPTEIWPGSITLVQGLAATLAGEAGPSAEELERAWRQILTVRSDLAACSVMLTLLERAANRQLAAIGDHAAASMQVERFLAQARLELLRALHASTQGRMNFLDTLVQNTHAIGLSVLAEGSSAAQQLSWLRTTRMNWGCLALWDAGGVPDARTLVVSATYSRDGDAGIPLGQPYPPAEFPPAERIPAATGAGGPDFVLLLPITTSSHDWGVLAMAGPVIKELSGCD